jgi:hypothetical protein
MLHPACCMLQAVIEGAIHIVMVQPLTLAHETGLLAGSSAGT